MRKMATDLLAFGMEVRLIPRPKEDRDQYTARAAATRMFLQSPSPS